MLKLLEHDLCLLCEVSPSRSEHPRILLFLSLFSFCLLFFLDGFSRLLLVSLFAVLTFAHGFSPIVDKITRLKMSAQIGGGDEKKRMTILPVCANSLVELLTGLSLAQSAEGEASLVIANYKYTC
ncbi:MAG: hypothetical protein KJZ93_04140 [Caldilineaceae bacterium]|nr:hypothetical protein [Caldilineaceae bacterium]